MPGRFISFEGTEGSGKTTQVRLLAERIRREGLTVRELREPGGTELGEEIRQTLKHSPSGHRMTPEAELLLMNAARAQLVREVIRPALAAGDVVLCDRFFHSTLAYQGFGRQLDLAEVQRIVDFAVGPTRPDLTLLLHVPHEVSLARLRARATGGAASAMDRFEEAGEAFFARVAQGFHTLASLDPDRMRVIDATLAVGRVHEKVWASVAPLLVPGIPDRG